MVCKCVNCRGEVEPSNDMRLTIFSTKSGCYLSHTVIVNLDEDSPKRFTDDFKIAIINEFHIPENGKVSRQAIFAPANESKGMHIAYTYQPRSSFTGRFTRKARVMCGKYDH